MKKFLSEKASVVLIFLGVVLIALGLLLFLWNDLQLSYSAPINNDKFGQFGDFIGGIVGSIWALAGVILFYVALTEQRKDLKINQQVLQQQIKEFELQRKELEETRQVFNLQKFDNTFFNLLKVQNDIFNSMSVDSRKIRTSGSDRKEEHKTHSGNRFFAYALFATDNWYEQLPKYRNSTDKDLKPKYLEYLNTKHKGINKNLLQLLDNFSIDNSQTSLYKLAFYRFYVGHISDFSKYVSHLSQILEYLDNTSSNNPELDYSNYPKFIKAQLSNDEKLIIWLVNEIEGNDQSLFLKHEIFKGMRPRIDLEELKEYC
ncbi:putative phage abortive infection protein [Imperialibacter roseus]|uniref:Phage abortive infection protein n=1 Tax=Imperialibacter roseus TaxID=1324217 RepID=A0ABZ0ISV8_9BACT|nr:putative phage abortive infection protein [Imperialibacter roseus]WOK07475.1 putative phage abortive infection protein [Imperialibacter roseus]